MLAAIRPDDVNFPLFLHVFGAMLLVGTLFAVALATVLAWRRPDDSVGLTRFSLRTLLMGVLPAYLLMRIGARDRVEGELPGRLRLARPGIGYHGGAGALLVLISLSSPLCLPVRFNRRCRLRPVGVTCILLRRYIVAVR